MTGVRILDLSRVLAGPWATQQLADQGAEVWKVEPPGGDETRRFAPLVQGESTYFLSCNRNKRSIVVDLKTAAGRAVLAQLATAVDVVVHNYRPDVAARFGVDGVTLCQADPRLVHVSLTGFGSASAEWAERGGYDLVLQAMGGAMSFTGQPGSDPIRAGTPIADLVAGLLVAQAVLHGLLHRERVGSGQVIEVNMMAAQAACLVYHHTRFTITGEQEAKRGNAHRGLVPYDVYPCQDGWLAIAVGNDGLWQRLREALDLPDHAEWRTNLGRVAARQAVDAAIIKALSRIPTAEADARLAKSRVPVGMVLDVAGTVAHPSAPGVAIDHPVLGNVSLPGPTLRTATTRQRHDSPPALDADRTFILAAAGFDRATIDEAAVGGAFGG